MTTIMQCMLKSSRPGNHSMKKSLNLVEESKEAALSLASFAAANSFRDQ